MADPLAGPDWFSWDEINILVCREPAFAHLSELAIHCALDWLGDMECDDGGMLQWSSFGEVYSRATPQFIADTTLEIVCALCGEVEEQSGYARKADAGFVNWLTSTKPFVAPLCRHCAGYALTFTESLRGPTYPVLRGETEYVSALHFITKTRKFKARVQKNARVFSALRFDPRKPMRPTLKLWEDPA